MHDHEEARLSRLVLMTMVIQVVAPVRLGPATTLWGSLGVS